MGSSESIAGVFAAAVTPLKPDLSPDLDGLINLINFLSTRGCHGVLLMGTTGEGPSFSINERLDVYQEAIKVKDALPDLVLLAGTGTPSLDDSLYLTKTVFNLGYDGAVILPPYYFRKATDEGLFGWFSQILKRSVPSYGTVLGYHIPPVSGVSLSLELLARLKDTFPSQFKGIKDSSSDPEWARQLGSKFGSDLLVMNGNDSFFSLALNSMASGCITAMANLASPLLRNVWDNFQSGIEDNQSQDKLIRLRRLFDRYPPMPPITKAMLSRLHGFPAWDVKLPLVNVQPDVLQDVISEYLAILE